MKNTLRPSKHSLQSLVTAYALKIYSARQNAPLRDQQRLHDAFERQLDNIVKRFPEYDFDSDAFWDGLQQRATAWWSKELVRGAGKHW